MTAPITTPAPLLRHESHLTSAVARTFVCHRFAVPAGAHELRIWFRFRPAKGGQYNNLLTLSLFDPRGFRGAGHRHAPDQEIVLGPHGATPGFLPGPIPAGEWLLEIDCHAVLKSDVDGVDVTLEVMAYPGEPAVDPAGAAPGATIEVGETYPAARAEGSEPPGPVQEWRPAAPPVGRSAGSARSAETPRAERWLRGDLHLHTQHSDGRWPIDDVLRYVERNRFDFIATTDHNTISAYQDVQWALTRAGLPAVVIPAMELTTFYGHANALGVMEWIDWRVRGPEGVPKTIGDHDGAPASVRMEEAAAEVHRLGGTFVINHPRSAGYPACTGCRWEFGVESAAYADAVEVWNGTWNRPQNHEGLALWDRWLNAGHRLPATAGTDAHLLPTRPEEQGYTVVWAAAEPSSILAAVRAGRSFLSAGPWLVWRAAQPGGLPDLRAGTLEVEVSRLHCEADFYLVRNGERVAQRPLRGDTVVELDLPDLAPGSWYRAELYRRGSSKLLAMTNPLWVD